MSGCVRMSRKKEHHLIDGRDMTVDEIAEMLDISVRALQNRKSRMDGDCSYQLIADMYRAGRFERAGDRYPRHLVDGEWITTAEAARRVGVRRGTLINWIYKNKRPDGSAPTLGEAMAYYRQYQTGERVRYKGKPPTRYRVGRRTMTVAEAAAEYRTTVTALRQSMYAHGRTLQQAVDRLEARRAKQAEREIIRILMEGVT